MFINENVEVLLFTTCIKIIIATIIRGEMSTPLILFLYNSSIQLYNHGV